MTEVIVPLIALAVVVAFSVWYSSGILKALHELASMLVETHRLIDNIHERERLRQKELLTHQKELLNRLMARDFDHFQAYDLAVTQSTEPDEVPDSEIRAQRPWIPGPPSPEETPEEIFEELEQLERSKP